MTIKGILQTLGTVSSLILGAISIEFTRHAYANGIFSVSSAEEQISFFLTIGTIGLTMFTGFSYFNSRLEHEGINYLLHICLGVTHVVLVPITIVIGSMKIEFGEYWWAVLMGIIILIIWGNGYKDSKN